MGRATSYEFLPRLLCACLIVGLGAGAVWAQSSVQSNSIVDALKAKTVRTRSISVQPEGMTTSDKKFIGELRSATRGIKFEERKKFATIVKQYDLPKIDLEIYFNYNSDKMMRKPNPIWSK